jgi:hypothetical protein
MKKQKFVLDNIPPLGNRTMVMIYPEHQEIMGNTDFSFEIKVTPSVPIKAVQCSFYFDPDILIINNMSGSMFSDFVEGTIDNVFGMVTGIIGFNNLTTPAIGSEGVLAMINGTSKDVDGVTTYLELVDVIVLDEYNNPVSTVIVDGTVEVEMSECPYDLSGDGQVNETDLLMVLAHFGEMGYPGWIKEDLSGPLGTPDGMINIFDVIALADHWGSCP